MSTIPTEDLPENFVRARRHLLLDHCFFGALLLRLRPVIDHTCESVWVDGKNIGINPQFFENAKRELLPGILTHNLLHCVLGHHIRRGNRNQDVWNDAADFAVNPIVEKSGLTLPSGVLMNSTFDNMPVEVIYDKLMERLPQTPSPSSGEGDSDDDDSDDGSEDVTQPNPNASPMDGQEEGEDNEDEEDTGNESSPGSAPPSDEDEKENGKEDGEGGEGDSGGDEESVGSGSEDESDASESSEAGTGDEGTGSQGQEPSTPGLDSARTGEVRDAKDEEGNSLSPADATEEANDWKVAVQQALMNAEAQGNLPGQLRDVIEEVLQATVDWREVLKRYFTLTQRSDLSWSRPNRRFIADDLYLPAVHSEAMGELVVAVDTSGSISSRILGLFQDELNYLVEEIRPQKVTMLMFDTRVTDVQEYTPEDLPIVLDIKGRGGTDFCPAMKYVQEQMDTEPVCMIYFTDLYGPFPEEPEFPVLWLKTGYSNIINEAPFGETVPMSEYP